MRYKFEEGVEDVGTAVSFGRAIRETGPYGVLIGNEKLEFQPVVIADRTLTGKQLLAAAEVVHPDNFLVFQMLVDGQLEEIRPEETVDLCAGGFEKFLVFRSDRTFRFFLNNRSVDWGATHISGATLKRLAGAELKGNDAFQVLHDGTEYLIHDDEFADLTAPGAERFIIKSMRIQIVVNARTKVIHHRRASYWEIVKLAFPEAVPSEKIIYTVDYTDGPQANPEGTMTFGQRVKLKDEMRFYVTPSDKS
jgi:hypothetical protein